MATTVIKRYVVCPCCRGSKVVGWLWWEKQCPECQGEGGYYLSYERRSLTGDYEKIVLERKRAIT